MRNKRWYEWLLLIVYLAMVALCVFLNLFSGQREELSNILVNAVMFVVVAIIFISCDVGCFAPMGDIVADLKDVTEKIRKDAMSSRDYLWKDYRGNSDLFVNSKLREAYEDYCFEMERNESAKDVFYKGDIEDYINTGMVDSVMRRNQLNQVAGALTGLGILGTFIGLSLGLQSFDTGSTAAITGSIEPLMNGIKVAFHTSIYGMVFSLVFNYVYKRKLFDSEQAVEEFVSTWKRFVAPDTSKDGTNRMLDIQNDTLKAIQTLSNRMSEEMAAQLKPNFDRLERLIVDFSRVATEDQKTALRDVVREFIAEMNRTSDNGLTKLGTVVEEQDRLTKNTVRVVEEYYGKVMKTEEEMKKNILSLNMQSENNARILEETRKEFKEVISACDDAADAADELRESLEKSPKGRR